MLGQYAIESHFDEVTDLSLSLFTSYQRWAIRKSFLFRKQLKFSQIGGECP